MIVTVLISRRETHLHTYHKIIPTNEIETSRELKSENKRGFRTNMCYVNK